MPDVLMTHLKLSQSNREAAGDGWQSPAYAFVYIIWIHAQEATGHSWMKFNHALSAALSTAIDVGLRFDVDDFEEMARSMRVGYWWGDDGGERFYRLACESRNLSACQAWESYRERPPFILHGNRLAAGMKLESWPGFRGRVHLNSYSGTDAINAASYWNGKEYQAKPVKRFKITRAMIAEQNKAARDAKKADKESEGSPEGADHARS